MQKEILVETKKSHIANYKKHIKLQIQEPQLKPSRKEQKKTHPENRHQIPHDQK